MNKNKHLPVIILRDFVIFPGASVEVFAQRDKAVYALKCASESSNIVIALLQKDVNSEDISKNVYLDMYV